jgi:cell division transport system permease protein
MKSLKNHVSVIIPLFVLLFSIQFTFSIKNIVEGYELKLIEEYSIVIVSQKPLEESVIKNKVAGVRSLTPISSKNILDRLKKDLSSQNLALLKVSLPNFYSVKLDRLPSEEELERITKNFKSINSITKVETFVKTHTKVYKMFHFIQVLSYMFAGLILIISVLLIFKQMKIWLLEHQERMSIMALFGAPFWMKSIFLYKLGLIDSFISSLLVSLLFWYVPKRDDFVNFLHSLGVEVYSFEIFKDTLTLLGISVIFSLFIVTLVISKLNNR